VHGNEEGICIYRWGGREGGVGLWEKPLISE
jgi:hypothetical protein